MEAVLVLMIVGAAFALMIYGGYRWIRGVFRRGGELKRLVHQGVTVTGCVRKLERIIRSRAGIDQLYLTYQFQDAGGQEHVKRLRVFSTEYDGASQGSPIQIVYLRDQPEVNALRSVVEEMRAALAKHPGGAA